MSASPGTTYTCQLCQNEYPAKDRFLAHIWKHLGYKKYPCNSCKETFYTEDERGDHCQEKGHDNSFVVTSSPYCEMLINMLVKDCDLMRVYDSNVIVTERARLNHDFETIIRERDGNKKKETPRVKPSIVTPAKTTPKSKGILKKAVSDVDTPSASTPRLPTGNKRKRPMSQSKEGPGGVEQSEMTKETTKDAEEPSLSTESALKIECGLCRKDIASDYVSRKDHVSRVHVGADHTADDYILVLEARMKQAFIDLTSSDLECQECRKTFKSNGGRREHVYKSHLVDRLECPVSTCDFAGDNMNCVNKHLKLFHGLEYGYKSLEDVSLQKKFEATFRKHNTYVIELQRKCFPCDIPPFYLNPNRQRQPSSMDTLIEDLPRIFQSNPPTRQLRRFSESSDSGAEELISKKPTEPQNKKRHDSEAAERDDGRDTPITFAEDFKEDFTNQEEPGNARKDSRLEEKSQPEAVETNKESSFSRNSVKREVRSEEPPQKQQLPPISPQMLCNRLFGVQNPPPLPYLVQSAIIHRENPFHQTETPVYNQPTPIYNQNDNRFDRQFDIQHRPSSNRYTNTRHGSRGGHHDGMRNRRPGRDSRAASFSDGRNGRDHSRNPRDDSSYARRISPGWTRPENQHRPRHFDRSRHQSGHNHQTRYFD